MDVVVCMKQIPNPDLQFRVAPDGKDIRREGLNYRTNGADEYALEAAVQLKEAHGGTVTVLTAGPKRTEEMLREALAKGADEAVRVTYDAEPAWDPLRTARILAAAAATRDYDLLVTGVQSDDHAHSLTGGLIAGYLGLPVASVVTRIEVEGDELRVHRELEGGVEEVVALRPPAVLTIQFGINQPRYAPLPAIMKAARKPIQELGPQDLGQPDWEAFDGRHAVAVRELRPPADRGGAEMIEGSLDEQVKAVARLLREKGFVPG